MLRFENQQDYLEVDLASQETGDLPSRGDAYVTVRVSAAGFADHNDLWVLAPVLRSFCRGLVALERNRLGEAVLESVSPDELRLVVRSVDSRGHMSVEGSTGYHVQRENSGLPWHSVHFGFEFDPSQLVSAISNEWVQRNAEPVPASNAVRRLAEVSVRLNDNTLGNNRAVSRSRELESNLCILPLGACFSCRCCC